MAGDAGEIKSRATMDNAEFVGALQQMAQAAVDNTQQMASTFASMSEKWEGIGSSLEKLGIGAAIADLGKEALDASTKVAQLTASFVAMNGAGESTATLLATLRDIAANSTFDFKGTLAPAAQNMMMLGVNAGTAAKTMQALADQAGALKQPGEYITQIAGDLGRMDAQVIVTTRSMRALTLDGIPAWQDLATAMGTDVPGALAKVKDGLVSAQQVNDAVIAGIEAAHAGAAAQTLDTWRGQFAQLKRLGDEALEALGDSESSILQQFVPVMKDINAAIQQAIDFWKNLSDPVKDAVIAFGAILAIIPALAGAIGALTLAFGLLGGPIAWITLAVAGIIAAFTALAVWVDQHRAAIIASIGDIKNAAIDLLTLNYAKLGADLSAAGKAFTDKQKEVITNQQVIAELNKGDAAYDAKKLEDNKKQIADEDTKARLAANQAALDAKTAKAAEDAAKKQEQHDQAERAGYDYLLTISPQLAAQYKASGDFAADGTEAAKKWGVAWQDLTTEFQNQVIAAAALAKNYADVGVAQQAMLEGGAAQAASSFDKITTASTLSSGSIAALQDGVTKKYQSLADLINTDLSDALKNGKITQDQYWQGIIDRSAQALIKTQEDYNAGLATMADVTAQQTILDQNQKKAHLDSIAELQGAYDTLGIHSQAAWDKSVAGAAAAAARINQAGPDTVAAAQATLDAYQKMYDDLVAQGQTFSQDQQATFDAQKQKVQDLTPELVKLTGAYKTLGETSIASLTDQTTKLGQAVLDVTKAKEDGLATDADVFNANQKLQGAMKSQADLMNGDLKQAWDTQKISADTYYTLVTQRALENAQAFAAASKAGIATAADVTAAWAGYAAAVKDQNAQILKDTVAAYTSIGTQTKPLMDQLVQTNKDHYATITGDAAASATLRISSEADMLAAMQKEHRDFGTTWGTDEQGRLDNDILYLQAHKTSTVDLYVQMWDAIGKAADTGVNNILDSAIDTLLKGHVSVWSAVKTAALDALDSMAKAILHVASDEVMGLLAKKVTELLQGSDGASGFAGLANAAMNLFKSSPTSSLPAGASEVGGVVITDVTQAASTAANAASSAAKSAGGVASTIAGTATNLLGTLSGISNIVTAVSSVADTLFGYDGIFGQAQKDGNVQNEELLRIFNTVDQQRIDDWSRWTGLYAVWANFFTYLSQIVDTTGQGRDYLIAISTAVGWVPAMAIDLSNIRGNQTYYGEYILAKLDEAHTGIQGAVEYFSNWGLQKFDALITIGTAQIARLDNMAGILMDVDQHLADVDPNNKTIYVNVTATGVTTKDAATAMGMQIAANMTSQLTQVQAGMIPA